jgi:hypothetical protein
VLAHELCHIAHRDALVMTVLGLPSLAARRLLRWWVRTPLVVFVPFLFFAWVGYALATLALMSLSRCREFVADRGAAVLTGAPEQLMSALQKIAIGLPLIPDRDLRDVVSVNAFFVLPATPESDSLHLDPLRIFPTHPPLARKWWGFSSSTSCRTERFRFRQSLFSYRRSFGPSVSSSGCRHSAGRRRPARASPWRRPQSSCCSLPSVSLSSPPPGPPALCCSSPSTARAGTGVPAGNTRPHDLRDPRHRRGPDRGRADVHAAPPRLRRNESTRISRKSTALSRRSRPLSIGADHPQEWPAPPVSAGALRLRRAYARSREFLRRETGQCGGSGL